MPQLEISTFLPQIFWLVITFAALYVVMWKIAVPGIAEVLESRQKRIEVNLEKAAKAKQEAEETLSAYEDSIKKANSEAQEVQALFAKKLSDDIQQQTEVLKSQQEESKIKDDSTITEPSMADELSKLAQLKDSGVLTEEEFLSQKEKLLNE